MPEKYKLTYFNVKGLSESIRYLLHYVGADFEDKRVTDDDWPALQKTLPYKKLPLFEVDGKFLNQSVCISRYIAQKYGLEHKDPFKRALLEAVVDNVRDLQPKIMEYYDKKTPESKKEIVDAMAELYKELDTIAADGYFYGTELTWVDIYFAGMADTMEDYFGQVLTPYPNLTALVKKIRSNDRISKYLKNRPASDPEE